MESIDGVASFGMSYPKRRPHNVVRIPIAVNPKEGVAAGEILVDGSPCIGSDKGVVGSVSAFTACETRDEGHFIGARMLIGVDGVVLGRDISVAEDP
jgi:hypothetical protein